MTKGFLSETFTKAKQAFIDSAPVAFFMRNSQWMSSWPFALGYAAMITKGGLNPDWDTAAGFLMIASAGCFMAQKNFPRYYRLSGALGAGAAICLALNNIDLETMQVTTPFFFAPLTGPLIANTLIGCQKMFSNFSQKHSDSSNRLVSTFAKAVRYPLLTAACVDLTNGVMMMAMTISNQDWIFLAAIPVFASGLLGIIASDEVIQEKYKNYMESKPPAAPALPAQP